ncbi:hypothetical protein L8106_08136 [Lyngbya sp. PCC 8106]|nr:hypothetical protein L8106_08136 [Lyngbya sp. PCC 8106]
MGDNRRQCERFQLLLTFCHIDRQSQLKYQNFEGREQ